MTSLNLISIQRLIWSPFRSFRVIKVKRQQNYLYRKHGMPLKFALFFFGTQSETVSLKSTNYSYVNTIFTGIFCFNRSGPLNWSLISTNYSCVNTIFTGIFCFSRSWYTLMTDALHFVVTQLCLL